jgi:hypothetical protein
MDAQLDDSAGKDGAVELLTQLLERPGSPWRVWREAFWQVCNLQPRSPCRAKIRIYSTGRCSMQMYQLPGRESMVWTGRAANNCSCTLVPWVNIQLG